MCNLAPKKYCKSSHMVMIVGVSDISVNRSLPFARNLTVESDSAVITTLLGDVFYNGSEPLVFIWYSNLRTLSLNENS